MRLFLTGGTGFVGSHVARAFLAHGWSVRALVRRPDRTGLLPDGVDIVPGDLFQTATYRDDLSGCRAVIHCAAMTSAGSLTQFRRVNGPGDGGLLPMFAVVARGVAPIPSGARRRVQLLAVEDLTRALFQAAQRPDLHGRRGFAAGDTVTIADLVREVAGLRKPRASVIPLPDVAIRLLGLVGSTREALGRTARPFNRDEAREILQSDWLCDGEPLLRDLQVTASTRWRDGIRRTCRWYVEAGWLASQAFAGV